MSPISGAALAKHVDSAGIAIAFVIVVLVLGLGVKSTFDFFDNSAWVEHTHQVLESLSQVSTSLSIARNARRGIGLTGDASEILVFRNAIRDLTAATASVRGLTYDNPKQQHTLDDLEPLLDRRFARMNAAIEYRLAHGFEFEREANETRIGTQVYEEVSRRLASLTAEERRLLRERERRTVNLARFGGQPTTR